MPIRDFVAVSKGSWTGPGCTAMPSGDTVRDLYRTLIEAWNRRDAADYAALFTNEGSIIGFDGSHLGPRAMLESAMRSVFKSNTTAPYVYKIREVLFLNSNAAILRAIAGMIPEGSETVNPDLNVIHIMTAVRQNGVWSIALLQNTPAQFHGMPEVSRMMTDELKELV